MFSQFDLEEHSMRRSLLAFATLTLALAAGTASLAAEPIKALIITGDNIPAHDWKGTTQMLQDILGASGGRIKVDVTTAPARDLTDENLAKYDVLVLNYKETKDGPEDTKWSDANKAAFLKAVNGGKGLVVHHFASAAFANPNWDEFQKAIAGGWRTQGYHGPKHEFKVKTTRVQHPVTTGLPAEFDHVIDELYSASMRTRGSLVLATAYADPSKPMGTGLDEAVVWVNTYGKGRVFENALGHDTKAMSDPNYQRLMRRGVEWAATGEVSSDAK
jgi:type 1 glutamine amidotransferase